MSSATRTQSRLMRYLLENPMSPLVKICSCTLRDVALPNVSTAWGCFASLYRALLTPPRRRSVLRLAHRRTYVRTNGPHEHTVEPRRYDSDIDGAACVDTKLLHHWNLERPSVCQSTRTHLVPASVKEHTKNIYIIQNCNCTG